MTFPKHRLLVTLSFAIATLLACGQDQAAPPTDDDTAVHDAEVAVASSDERMAKGQAVYNGNCAACHQPDGTGLKGAFPPLAGSDFLQGNRRKVIGAALFGLSGPITVNGEQYTGVMPSQGHLPNEDLAAALTYVFQSWGNDLAAVSVDEVASIRAELGAEDRAAGERHVGTTEGELTYKGAPVAMSPEGARQVTDVEGPVLSEAEFDTATRLYFERCAG
ncbi:MAG: cytochrome c, partial [Woeseiaceae bacterium]